jgi:hypothetical protein
MREFVLLRDSTGLLESTGLESNFRLVKPELAKGSDHSY